ncbi:conserved hypothetical protein [Histoplasma capsulatum G186AR]|uniref:Uncharacterized protein n=2 Tax=Ajellomyces capsulatus TaxID=5037 RepID=C0NVU2_AJECG|nr:uncharacterized protein HCBG_07272 [Histoplasma capsulatum G186AR]EEH04631.1 conserved hypothetical protein [Histoplasma capsulatum G186AR]KAG5296463.1 hypothetical protein I7I52_07156 [Histoplasma capsulatum]QSS74446.1 hypothetical protein I7I50_09626 [Histoplasma capsulatum G186AR]
MDRQGADDPLPLPSQLLLSGAQQSTLPAYREMLGDFLQKAPFQTYASASLNILPTHLSVDRTNQSQRSGDIPSKDRDNISDSEATTEPLVHGELENRHYWCEAWQVEKSLKIHHVGGKVWRNNKYVHRVLYVVETYLPDNWLPENARLQLWKEEEKKKKWKTKMQRKKRLSTLRPRPSTRN